MYKRLIVGETPMDQLRQLAADIDAGPGQSQGVDVPPTIPCEGGSHPASIIPPEVTVDQLLAGPCAYLSGPAGTGKTWLARQIIEQREDAVLCATTGIAAVNLGDATTINALLGYFDTQSLQEQWVGGWLGAKLRKLRRSGVRILVLDEVSMLDAEQLTVLSAAIDQVNLTKEYDQSTGEVTEVGDPLQDLKLILVGDFAQLPPVKAQFAFTSPRWALFRDHTFTLSTIHRQDDRQFIEALQAIRKGEPYAALDTLTPCLAPTLDFTFNGTTIVAKNDEVDRINGLRFAKLEGEEFSWKATRSGEQQKDWLRLIPEEVWLKVGALVMVLANHSLGRDESGRPAGFDYVNGDLGEVLGKDKDGVQVRLQRTDSVVTIYPQTHQWKEPTGKKKEPFSVRGAITRMPLRLAYASTVHKSQGLSLDRVQVGIASWMFNQPGMLYVALSRARSLAGLRIVGNAKQLVAKCKADPRVGGYL